MLRDGVMAALNHFVSFSRPQCKLHSPGTHGAAKGYLWYWFDHVWDVPLMAVLRSRTLSNLLMRGIVTVRLQRQGIKSKRPPAQPWCVCGGRVCRLKFMVVN